MNIESYKSVYSDKSPTYKVTLMCQEAYYLSQESYAKAIADYVHNNEDSKYHASEYNAHEERLMWLAEELTSALKAGQLDRS